MRRKNRRLQEEAGLDLTPMMDIVFIMLIFFIVTTSFVKETGIEVNRPNADTAERDEKGNILVAISQNNEIWIDKRRVDLKAVRANIERLKIEYPEGSVIIQADKEARSGLLVETMDQIRLAGVQNISIAKRQGIPKRYLEQTLQTLVKNNILVASRGPNGGYRLAKERRKIMVSDIISSVSSSRSSDLKDFYNTQISKFLIEPLITKVTKKSFELLNNISVEDIYKLATTSKNQNLKKKKVDFVI